MYCSSPLISSSSKPTSRTTILNLYPFRHPSPPFNFHHHHHKVRCRIRPTNLTLKVNSTHRPIFSKPTKTPNENPFISSIAKPIAYAVFWIALGLCPFRPFQPPAIAISSSLREKGSTTEEDFNQPLLNAISDLNSTVQKVRDGKGDLEEVMLALEKVKYIRSELSGKIVGHIRGRRLIEDKHIEDALYNLCENYRARDDHFEDFAEDAAYLFDSLLDEEGDSLFDEEGDNSDKVKGKLSKIMQTTAKNVNANDQLAKRCDALMDQIQDLIKDQIRREDEANKAIAIALSKLYTIEAQCILFVDDFTREMKEKRIPSSQIPASSSTRSPLTKLSRSEIQKDLRSAQRQILEQMILPKMVKNEDIGNSFDQEPMDHSQRLKEALEESREAQKNLEASLRENLKKLGDEKRVLVHNTPEDIEKGFPEVELKWMFGNKEIVVPNAVKIHLYHGWRKWQEEFKDEQKRNLLENVEVGKKYVAERQERILLERDKVMSHTWFNEEKNRWEIDPAAAHYAASRKLVKRARIMSDLSAVYLFLKGDEKEHYVDLEVITTEFEDFGERLFLQMVAAGIPMAVQLIGIPDTKLTQTLHSKEDLCKAYLMALRELCKTCKAYLNHLIGLLNNTPLLHKRDQLFRTLRNTFDDLLVVAIIPAIDLINSYLERTPWGMIVLKYADQKFNWTFFLNKWQNDLGRSFRSRNDELTQFWFLIFPIRVFACGLIVLIALSGGIKLGIFLLVGSLGGGQNLENMNRVRKYFRYRKRRLRRRKRGRKDPIASAFDRMKRVKNPPIRLKDFANVDSMREEVNEVVSFLQNPHVFQEMGARAPRGVLIAGESGSGKTSLALAIAAEANVPVVRVQPEQLELGSLVGQGASNIRELFQTARDLAPVIIFVEDFDVFAGIRGKHIDTKKQDHEAFINQLLVELDGFEKQEGVVLMATTQSINKIDKALTRPGRMDRIFHLQRPTQCERERILRSAAKESMDKELVDFVDWEKVAEKTALMRPKELRSVPPALEGGAFNGKVLDADELMSYCSWFVTLGNMFPTWVKKTNLSKRINKILINYLGLGLTKEDMENVVDLMEPYGVISSGMELANPYISWTRETKFPHAVWAAGRGLIGALLPNFDTVHNLWLERSSCEGVACTKITKEERGVYRDGTVESRSYLEKKLVFLFGSYVAAQMLLPFGEENLLSSTELEQAQEIATTMVIQYGWGPSDNPTIYYNNSESTLSMGDNHFYEMASNVEKLYYLAYDKAKAILQSNRSVLEKVVEELVEFEVLERKDLERIISENGGTREIEPFFLSKSRGEQQQQSQPVFRSLLENGSVSGSLLIT